MRNRLRRILIVLVIVMITGVTVLYAVQRYTIHKIQSLLTTEKAEEIDRFLSNLNESRAIEPIVKTPSPVPSEPPSSAAPSVSPTLVPRPSGVPVVSPVVPQSTSQMKPTSSNDMVVTQKPIVPTNPVVSQSPTQTDAIAVDINKVDVESIRKKVSLKDQVRGLQLAGKLDISYIMSLVSGGMTKEKEAELKKYLKQKFTDDEIKEIEGFYAKYSYLLKQ